MSGFNEPRVWSSITDGLPEDHPLAGETLHCGRCGEMLHAGYNELMQTWVELPWPYRNSTTFCLYCFVSLDSMRWETEKDRIEQAMRALDARKALQD